MLKIKQYLKDNDISVYKLAKDAGVAYPTVFNIVNGKTEANRCAYGVLKQISQALDMTTDQFARLCHPLDWFYVFRSEQQHQVRRKGELQYIIDTLENDVITELWEEDQKKALYVLAMVDYLSKRNGLPQCTKYNKLRAYKLSKPLFPIDIELTERLSGSDVGIKRVINNAIPEFYAFNIVEGDFL